MFNSPYSFAPSDQLSQYKNHQINFSKNSGNNDIKITSIPIVQSIIHIYHIIFQSQLNKIQKKDKKDKKIKVRTCNHIIK